MCWKLNSRLACIFALLWVTWDVCAQHVQFKHYTAREGLRDVNLYDIVSGPDHKLWMATEHGIITFDGRHFQEQETFRKHGPEGSAIRLLVHRDTVWVGTHKNGVYGLKGDSVWYTGIPTATSKELISVGNRLLILGDAVFLVNPEKQQIDTLNPVSSGSTFLPLDAQTLLWLQSNQILKVKPNGTVSTFFDAKGGIEMHSACFNQDTLWVGAKGGVYAWVDDGLELRVPFSEDLNVNNLFRDREGYFWFTDGDRGLYYLKNGRLINLGAQLDWENVMVSAIHQDQFGSIWVATLGNGLYRFHNTFLTSIGPQREYKGGEVFCFQTDAKGRNWMVADHGIYHVTASKLTALETPCCDQFRDMAWLPDDVLAIAAHPQIGYLPDTTESEGITHVAHLGYAVAVRDRMLTTSYYSSLVNLFPPEAPLRRIRFDESLLHRTHRLCWFQNLCWQATTQGLRVFDEEGRQVKSWMEVDVTSPKTQPLSGDIRDLYAPPGDTIWVATDTAVLAFSHAQKPWDISVLAMPNIAGINSLTKDDRGRWWIATRQGLIAFRDGKQVVRFDHSNGLISDHVTALHFDASNRSLLIGTARGVQMLNLASWEHQRVSAPQIALASLANQSGGVQAQAGMYEIGDRDVMKVAVNALHFGEVGPLHFRFSLDDREVGFSSESKLILSGLEAGEHRLSVVAKSINSEWSAPLSIPFQVVRPWYRSRLFYVLLLLLAVSVGFGFLLWRQRQKHRQVQREIALQTEMERLRQQGLQALLRPHFASNILTAVRIHVKQNNRLEADTAMAQLGRLMRTNLEMAQRTSITVLEEVNWLRDYIELERFARQVPGTFSIEIDAELQPGQFEIPPMLVQPFIENAIAHAMDADDAFLHVRFQQDQTKCIITICDNGPGMPAAAAKKENHVSQGIHILQQRLKLLTLRNGQLHEVTFQNGKTTGQNFGTLVTLQVPFMPKE